jgi:hypothetical protein
LENVCITKKLSASNRMICCMELVSSSSIWSRGIEQVLRVIGYLWLSLSTVSDVIVCPVNILSFGVFYLPESTVFHRRVI